MLSLQLKSGEYLTIGDEIAVQIFEESGSTFRVAVKAPREIPILRGEVLELASAPAGCEKSGPRAPPPRPGTPSACGSEPSSAAVPRQSGDVPLPNRPPSPGSCGASSPVWMNWPQPTTGTACVKPWTPFAPGWTASRRQTNNPDFTRPRELVEIDPCAASQAVRPDAESGGAPSKLAGGHGTAARRKHR